MNKTLLAGATCAGLILAIAGPASAKSICAAFHGTVTYPACPKGGTPTANGPMGYLCYDPGTTEIPATRVVSGVSHINGGGAANGASGSFAKGDVISFSWSNVKDASGPLGAKLNDNTNSTTLLALPYPSSTLKYTFPAASSDYFDVAVISANRSYFKMSWSCSGP